MHQDQAPGSSSLRIDSVANRRELLIRLLALPAALGLAAQAEPESAEARKKRRKKKRRRRGRNAGGGDGGGSGNDGSGGGNNGGGSPPDDQEHAFLGLINAYRKNKGRNPLTRQNQLDAAAERHSRDQAANNFSDHDGSDGSTPDERIEDAGYDWRNWGENVYWNSNDGSADAAFQWWKKSPGHNDTMLGANFTEIGIARVRNTSSGRWYWTTTFGRR